jgi:TRAP-type C4-dicarboxylate transport system substrate-binding protein
VEDLKGLKLRVNPQPDVPRKLYRAGGESGSHGLSRTVRRLGIERAMDAQENPFSVVLTSKFNEVQKYMSVTNHVYNRQSGGHQQEGLGQAVCRSAEDGAGS